jgi:hypothetical protein
MKQWPHYRFAQNYSARGVRKVSLDESAANRARNVTSALVALFFPRTW